MTYRSPVVVPQTQSAVRLPHQSLDVNQRHDDAFALQLRSRAGEGRKGGRGERECVCVLQM